jgi:hypothetical protein
VSLHDWVNSLPSRVGSILAGVPSQVLIHIPDLSGRVRSTLRKRVTNGLKPGYHTLPLFQSCRWWVESRRNILVREGLPFLRGEDHCMDIAAWLRGLGLEQYA